jgi:nucleoside-diphosphate-sugar epimerase
MYQYFCQRHETPVALLRLNYATELRYGVLVDLAQQIADEQPVDVTMGYVNVIWLGDANAMTLAALGHAGVPANIINLAGPEIVSVREVALQLAAMMNKTPIFVGQEQDDALLNNGRRGHQLLGQPSMPVSRMLEWTAHWISRGRPTLGKPTHFQTRSGAY